MMRGICRLVLAITAALTLSTLPALALLASADVNGNCSATINGVDVKGLSSSNAGDAIEVKEHTAVPVTMQSAAGITRLRVQIEFAGIPWTVRDEPTSGTSWENSVPVDKYAKYGVGLYKVIGRNDGPTGTCSGSALVRVVGNPLTTVAGAAAAGITDLGGLGLAAAGVASALEGQAEEEESRRRLRERFQEMMEHDRRIEVREGREREERRKLCFLLVLPALLLTGAAMAAGAGPPPGTKPAARLRRAGWRPRLSVAGIIGGLLAGAGTVVLLQQYAVVYPTRAVAIEGLAGGLALGLVMPSLLRVFAVWRANRTIASAERHLNSALAQQPAPATQADARLDEAPNQQPPPPTVEAEHGLGEAPNQQPPPPTVEAEHGLGEAPAQQPPPPTVEAEHGLGEAPAQQPPPPGEAEG